jgi:hypothetical protein
MPTSRITLGGSETAVYGSTDVADTKLDFRYPSRNGHVTVARGELYETLMRFRIVGILLNQT